MKQNWNLEGQKALITGGSKGIGKAIVLELCEFGAEVLYIAREKDDLEKMKQELQVKGFKGEYFMADVSSSEQRKAISDHISGIWDRLDILINNVGMNIRKKAEDYREEEFSVMIETNLKSSFELSVKLLPFMQKSREASIVNIASVAGLGHLRTGVVYGMSKAGMIQMTKNLAVEWAPYGIRVNAIAPWYIKTPMTEAVLKDDEYLYDILHHTPMNKIGDPEDVASPAVFLCMPAARYITGQCLAVDGGLTAELF